MGQVEGYTLLEEIYSGNFMEVIRATRHSDNKLVILKRPHNEHPTTKELALLQHEYDLLKNLKLPNLIQVYDFIKSAQQPVLVLEDISGISLDAFLNKKPLPLDIFFPIALQIITVISDLHKKNIIHKDIKPVNIIIDAKNLRIKLSDLSISCRLNEQFIEYGNINLLEGTFAYIAPEQTGRINRTIDYRVDFYSLGVTLFEMLTGTLPFQANDSLEWVHCHIAKIPPLVSSVNHDIPEMLSVIVNKLLSKMPEDRYLSAHGLKSDIQKCFVAWKELKTIPLFALGKEDRNDRLHISHKLYGREVEIKQLISAFERSRYGQAELILVSGYSGIGKTALVKEIYQPLAMREGSFIQGKFDLLQRGTPYSAIITAFQSLVKQILAEPDHILSQIRIELSNALGNMGQIIIDVIPDLERIIGQQPPLPVVNAKEARNRFHLVMQRFIQIFAKAKHQLVIFIDDLQWADSASLELIENLLLDENSQYLLIVGAYRANEIDDDHPINYLIKTLEKSKGLIQQLIVQPLQQDDISNLLKDTFNCSLEKTQDLAQIIQEKTEGNPFYINEFINNIYINKLIYFNYDKNSWDWDIEIIKKQTITSNVIDMLTHKIKTLPVKEKQILKQAACIGYKIDFLTLASINGNEIESTALLLWELVKKQIIHPLDSAYQTLDFVNCEDKNLIYGMNLKYVFSHDRIQNAVYQLTSKEFKMKTHFSLGMYFFNIWNIKKNKNNDVLLFLVMDHINKCHDLLIIPEQRRKFVELSLAAAQKAKNAAAFSAAINYLINGIDLLTKTSWEYDYVLTNSLYLELLECRSLTGNNTETQELANNLLSYSKTEFDKAVIYSIKALSYASLNKLIESTECNIKALRYLSIDIPLKPSLLRVIKEIFLSEFLLWRKDIKILAQNLPEIKDPKNLLVAKILNDLAATSHLISDYLYAVVICSHFRHLLTHGYSVYTSPMYYCCFRITGLKMYDSSLPLSNLAVEFEERLGNKRLSCANHAGFAWIIAHLQKPLTEVLEHCEKSIQLGQEVGELIIISHCQILRTQLKFFQGISLEEILLDNKRLIKFLEQSRTGSYEERYSIHLQPLLIQYLQGDPSFQYEKVTTIIKLAEKTTFVMLNIEIYLYLVMVNFIIWNPNEALYAANKGYKLHNRFPGTIHHVFLLTFCALTYAKSYPMQNWYQKNIFFHRLKTINKLLKIYNNIIPINYSMHYLLISAEIERIARHLPAAIHLYNKALKAAISMNNKIFIGIINEKLAEVYIELEDDIAAKNHLKETYYTYQTWGANGKCKQLSAIYPEYSMYFATDKIPNTKMEGTVHQSTSVDLQTLDLMAVLKSTQALASEIELDKLLQKLIEIVLQDSGAQRAVLLLKNEEEWIAEAEGDTSIYNIVLNRSETIAARTDLPLTLIQYVKRTSELLIANNASEEEFFSQDPYIQNNGIKSLLIMPIINQGKFKRILYLENNINSRVFTPKLLQTIQFLISQAIISLENASLYHEATHDLLTGLANRNLLNQTFISALARAKRSNLKIAILFLDLDHFKRINDTLGHQVGDQLLQHMAMQIKASIRESDLAVRLGGDEFVVVLESIEHIKTINDVVTQFYSHIGRSFTIQGHELTLSSSIGISLYPMDGEDIDTLLKNADKALYQAKESGRNCFRYYSEMASLIVQHENDQEYELEQAIKQNQFCLYYQPIYDMHTGRIISLEALLRWQHPKKGILSPIDIISRAEKNDLIIPIGNWVLQEVCRQLNIWKKDNVPLVPIAVNISALQLKSNKKPLLSEIVKDILDQTSTDPSYLELELTESVFIDNSDHVLREVRKLKSLGLSLNIDDFGAGYSNLGYLKRLPISKIKIDQSFLHEINTNEEDRAILKAIITMADQLKLNVIVEGVENFGQYQFLKKLHVDGVQGFYLQYPVDASSCQKLLINKT